MRTMRFAANAMPDSQQLSRKPTTPVATVAITTRNRRQELCRAIDSVLRQEAPIEVVVMDDGSTDGTAEMLARQYPSVRVFNSPLRLGLVVQRNRAAEHARGGVLFSLDDDAAFTDPHTIADVLAHFDHPRVGAVAMPVVNVIGGRRTPLGVRAPKDSGFWVTMTYIGAAHAVRRDLFLGLGGYEAALYQWGEEENFCQKLYANGYVVRVANCAETQHFPHPVGRHGREKNVWIYRNSILNAWFYAPSYAVPLQMAFETIRWLARKVSTPRALPVVIEGLARGYAWALSHPEFRRALPFASYRLYLRLRRARIALFADIENRLPDMRPIHLPVADSVP